MVKGGGRERTVEGGYCNTEAELFDKGGVAMYTA
jgi:hypothetical protein